MSSKTSYCKLRFVEEDTYFKLTGIETNMKPQYLPHANQNVEKCKLQVKHHISSSFRNNILKQSIY